MVRHAEWYQNSVIWRRVNLISDDGDDENPLATVESETTLIPAAPMSRFIASIKLGSAGGYVSGNTEVLDTDIECCLAPEPIPA